MKLKAMAGSVAVLFLFLVCPLSDSRAHQEPHTDQNLYHSSLIESITRSVVAVGTYYFNDVPKSKYLGTGFAVADGRKIITNYHVIEPVIRDKKASRLRIFHREFESAGIKVKIVKVDPFHDLAVLEKDGEPLKALNVNSREKIKPGYHVVFSGYPIGLVLGLNPTTHKGMVSNVTPLVRPSPTGRIIDGKIIRHLDAPYDVYQIDGVAFPGNSGSPVCLLSTGEVIAVINQVFVKGKKEHALTDPSGITYAIPAEFVKALLEK